MKAEIVSSLLVTAGIVLAACTSTPELGQASTGTAPATSDPAGPTTTVRVTATTSNETEAEISTTSTMTEPTLDLEAVAQGLGLNTVVIESNGVVRAVSNGTSTESELAAGAVPWSDGTFIYWITDFDSPDVASTATDLDGTIRCEVAGAIAEAQAADGDSVVATVWDPVHEFGEEAVDVPYSSVDCGSGERTPIDSRVTYELDSQSTFVQHVGDRTFRGFADAEGNAEVVNEADISVNGEDYAGFHTFSPDGSVVIYGDMRALATPHYSDTLHARDTQTGALLWTAQLTSPFISTHHNGDFVVVGLLDSSELFMSFDLTTSLAVLDATTGELISRLDVETNVLFAG